MYLRGMLTLIICLVSGCAFIDGLHNPGEPVPAQQDTQEVAPPASNNVENRADTNAAKALAPLTH